MRLVVEYVSAQVWNGANVVKIFEVMGMIIKDDDGDNGEEGNTFVEWYMPCLKYIYREIKRRYPGTTLMVFTRGPR